MCPALEWRAYHCVWPTVAGGLVVAGVVAVVIVVIVVDTVLIGAVDVGKVLPGDVVGRIVVRDEIEVLEVVGATVV